ncbi:NADPH:quinone oxidoreductase family protein [Nocardia heshunensis]
MNPSATMHALIRTSLDDSGELRPITDAPVPVPGPGEILIRVTAAGVNYADVMQARGTYPDGPQPPYVAGIEAAGEVVAAGEGVEFPSVGMHVAGIDMMGGAFAEYATLPAAAVMPVPPDWTDEQVLGLGINWPTALAALKPLGRITSGDTVLIHAAAGATGQAAVLLARHYGATVLAAASPGKHDVVRALGADHVLDSRSTDLTAEVMWLTDGAGVDLVLESVGGTTFETSLAVAKRVTGRVVVYGTSAGDASITNWDLVFKHQVQLIGLNIGVLIRSAPGVFGELMGELSGLLAAGVIPPGRPAVHPLMDGPKVLVELENRSTVGKLALIP